ncbi:MAG TPA: hypothetical protein VID50_04925 [Candidatus Eisenbacteria bacterium]
MRSRAAAAILAGLLAAPGAAQGHVVERILAVVDGRPLLLSEVRVLERLRGLDRKAAVDALIDERLMFREAVRLPQAVVTTEEEERAYRELVSRVAPGSGTTEEELRRLARRQTAILKYIEFRFRPQVRIADAEVRAAWEEERAERPDTPPFEEASAALRARLESEELDKRIEEWVGELRAGAEIRYNR